MAAAAAAVFPSARQRDGDRPVGATVPDPQRVACRLDGSGLLEALPPCGDGGLIAIDGDHAGAAVMVLRQEQLAMGGAHAVRPLDRAIRPDLLRRAGLAR